MNLDSRFSSEEVSLGITKSSTQKRTFQLAAAFSLALAGVNGCQGSVETTPNPTQLDGGTIDASEIDSSIDAGMDASDDGPDASSTEECPTPSVINPLDITRQETAQLLVTTAGLSFNVNGPMFPDVTESNPYYPFILTAANDKIMGSFSVVDSPDIQCWMPLNDLNRAEYAKFIVKAFNFPINTDGGPHFKDVSDNAWFYGYVETLYNNSVDKGYSDGTFRPSDNEKWSDAHEAAMNALTPTKP